MLCRQGQGPATGRDQRLIARAKSNTALTAGCWFCKHVQCAALPIWENSMQRNRVLNVSIALVIGVLLSASAVAQQASEPRTAPAAQTSKPTGSSASASAVAPPLLASQPSVATRKPTASHPYFIEFRARYALSYGHTYAVHGRVGQKITKKDVIGLHPATESSLPWMIGHLTPVISETGASDGDAEEKYVSARYRILLTAAEYAKLKTFMDQLKSR